MSLNKKETDLEEFLEIKIYPGSIASDILLLTYESERNTKSIRDLVRKIAVLEEIAETAADLRASYDPQGFGGTVQAKGRMCKALDKLAVLKGNNDNLMAIHLKK